MDPLGTELPRRTTTAWGLVLVAAVLTIPCVRMVQAAAEESGGTAIGAWAMAVALALVLVVAPLLLARSVLRRRTYVSDDAVTVTSGTDVRRLAFVDLDEVRVRFSGNSGRRVRNDRIFLIDRERRTMLVTRWQVEPVRPLLERLAVEVARRPALLRSDVERGYFEHALTTDP